MKLKECLLTHGLPITRILFRIVRLSSFLFKCNYLKKEKHFVSFFCHLRNLYQILNFFKKKKIVIANVFPKLRTVKDLVLHHSLKTAVSEHPSRVNMLKGPKHLSDFSITLLWRKMIWETFPLLKFEMIRIFVDTSTFDYKYPVPDCENFPFPIQMQLS